MKKKILLISSIILGVVTLICIVLVIKNANTKNNETKISKETTSTKQESIVGQNDINNTFVTSIETEDEEIENTEEKSLEQTQEKIKEETKEEKAQETTKEIKQETKEEVKQEVKQVTQDKKIENTQEKTTSKVTKETTGTVEKQEQSTTTTVPTTQNEQKAPEQAVEQEPAKPVEEPKEETKKIDLSKYDYYENSLNGSYKGFIKDDAEMSKLKSLIDTAINEFGYTNVKIVQDSSLPKSGLRSFTANKINVENLVYDSDGFTICYYAVKEYHISSDGTETFFQTRSYIKVK